ncbi:PAS domain S-box protein, partial [Candidatus Bathyarchaeota archaeon]|nr:PAS domain S-box protein [Candidatus Bathyarchaeota archaeon]
MLGFSSKEEVIGKSSFDFFAEKDRQKAYANMKRTSEQGTVRNVEYALLNKDGEEVWGELSASIIKDSSGNPSGFVGIMRDITARKKTEKTLSKAMRETNALRRSGIEVVGSFPWGTHLCQFYRTKDDLLETLVPYFSEGLRNNEYCMWVTSEPLGIEEAKEAMRKAVPDFDRCLERGQIEIIPHTEWYLKHGVFNSKRVLDGWINRLNEALAKGYDGLRLTGNTFWLEKKNWDDFFNYEKAVNSVIEQYKMIAICTYCLDKCGASEVIDVVSNHQFALIRESGEWKIVESSELKYAREEVGRSGEILRDVFACSPDAITVIGLNGKIVECNQEALDLLGYSSKDELIGRNGFALVAEKDRERAKGNLTKVLDHGSMKNIEYIALTKDGTEFSAELSASVVKDSSGNLMGFVGITKDITERKQMEKQLKESEEKYRNLVENCQDAIAIVNFKGNVLFANKAAERLTGYTLKEGKGLNIRVVTPKRYWPKSVAMLLKARMGKSIPYFEYELKRTDGTIVPVETGGQAIFEDGKPVAIQIITREVTERRKTEEALRQSEEKHRDLFENAMDVILTLDLKGSITTVNNSVLRFGYKKEDLVGKDLLDFVSKEYWPAVMRDFSKVARGEPAKNETELVVPAGKILVEYHAGAIVKENNVAGVQINIRDVTERKKGEELLRESEERFRSLFESIQDPVGIFVGREGRLIDYNAAFKKSSGYTDEELKGKAFLDFVHPDDHAMVLEKYQTKYSEEELPLAYEIRVIDKKGESIPLELSVSTYKKKGKVIGIEVIHRDLTERKKAEQTLEESEEKYRDLVELAPDGIVAVNTEGIVTSANRSFLRLV